MTFAELRSLKAEYRRAVLAAARLERKRFHPSQWAMRDRDLELARRDIVRLEASMRAVGLAG